jgi:hypothetical protein
VGRPDSYTAAAGAVKPRGGLADVGVAQHPGLANQTPSSADHEATTMTTITIPTLTTHRLTLRGFTATDLDALAPIYADPQVSRYIGDGTPADRTATWRALAGMLGHWQLRGFGMWALIERASGRLIGRAGLYNPEGWPGLEAGWLLARDRWGTGLPPRPATRSWPTPSPGSAPSTSSASSTPPTPPRSGSPNGSASAWSASWTSRANGSSSTASPPALAARRQEQTGSFR